MSTHKLEFSLGNTPHLHLHGCSGDLEVQGWEREQMQLQFDSDEVTPDVQETDGVVHVSRAHSCIAYVPRQATVLCSESSGDVKATDLQAVTLSQAHGDLSLERVNVIDLTEVHGDVRVNEAQTLHATKLYGDVRIQALQGELTLTDVAGDVVCKQVNGKTLIEGLDGSLMLRQTQGEAQARGVNGDIVFRGLVQTGQVDLQARGDIVLRLDPGSSVHLEIEASSGNVRCDAALGDEVRSEHSLSGRLGQGEAQLKALSQQGDILVRTQQEDEAWATAEEAGAHVEAMVWRQVERAERMAEKIRRKSERITQKAQKRAAAERSWRTLWTRPPSTASGKEHEAERLAVLKMLAEGKISTAQAESLLGALED